MSEILVQMKEIILAQQQIMIISHSNPDGDTLGSQLALADAVNQFGIDAVLINKDELSVKYSFLNKYEQVRPLEDNEITPKVIVFVDCASMERSGYAANDKRFCDRIIINIDHHLSNQLYGALNYVQDSAAANVQVIVKLLQVMEAKITPAIATALYLGLSTDTGSFLFDSVSANTHRLAAELIDAGADTDQVRMNIYESTSVAKFRLLKHIYEHTTLEYNGVLSWSQFSHELLMETKADSADIDGVINNIKNIDGVEIAILFRELDENKVKISFRSKNWADVNQLAAHFGGGGHIRAAGCTILAPLEEVKTQVLAYTRAYLAEGTHD